MVYDAFGHCRRSVAAGILACRIRRHLAARFIAKRRKAVAWKNAFCINARLEAGRYGSQDGRRYFRPAISGLDSRPAWME
jgi:hypothetical protein